MIASTCFARYSNRKVNGVAPSWNGKPLPGEFYRPWVRAAAEVGVSRISKIAVLLLSAIALVFFGTGIAYSQQLPPEVEQMGYADSIFINGKVVSMDDASISTSPGSIYQAIAVKNDKIMKLGTSDEVRALAGARITTVYDLKGRTLIPGIIEPHQHIYGSVIRYADRFGLKFPPRGINVSATADKDLEKTRGIIRDTIREAVKKVEPGDWIMMSLRGHPDQPEQASQWGFTRRLPNRRDLDVWASENPVLVRPGLRGNINSRALEILNDILPGYSASIHESMHGDVIGEDVPALGWVGSQEMAVIQWELFMQNVDNNVLAQMLKLVSEEWAALGVTTWGTRIPFPKVMSGYAKLAEMNQMPIRLNAHYEVHRMPTDPQQTRQLYRRTGVLNGIGGDYMWFDGVASERWDSHVPEGCMGPDTQAPPHIKARETCPKAGDLHWDTLKNAIKSGWRMTGVHMIGSEALRQMVQMIESAIAESSLTLDEVRNQMYSFEHCEMIGKQPEIIDLLTKYNFILSCGPNYFSDSWTWLKDYGPTDPDILKHFSTFNTWIKAGVNLVGQHYGSGVGRGGEGGGEGFQPPFFMLWQAITRRYDGKVWQPEERIDRVHALKMWTRWAANYVRHPDQLGSLELGKWADLLIIDRDYLTIPEDEILKIRPLMTIVGGRTIALNESLAEEWGVEAVGPQFNFEDEALEWIGTPLTEEGKREAGMSSN